MNKREKRIKIIVISLVTVFCLALAAGIVAVVMQNYGKTTEDNLVMAKSYEDDLEKTFVLENDDIKFELSAENTQFTVTNKETGYVWDSTPKGAEDDPIALSTEKERLQSTVFITYSTKNGVDTPYNNYAYGTAEAHLYEIEQGADYIKVCYSIGTAEKEFVIPPVISKKRMDELLSGLSKGDQSKITDYYKKYDIKKLGKKDNKEELLERYPMLADTVIYALRDTTKNTMKKKMEELFAEVGYTVEEWEEDKLNDTSVSVSDKPVFNLSMIYRIEGKDLIVEVPYNELEFQAKYPLYNITVLPNFGAGGTDDEGFMLIPEGGGAIIDFNNGKVSSSAYYANLYGWDMCTDRSAVVHDTRANFNAFGVSKNGESFICMIDEGSSYASIQANISGKLNSYNVVNANVSMLHREQYDVGIRTTTAMFTYEEELPDEKLVQRYRFVSGGTYSDMAHAYGDYLEERYSGYLTEKNDTEAPVVIEMIGAIDKIKKIFGVPVNRPYVVTDDAEAVAIAEELKSEGLNNMSVKLLGYINGGVEQKIAKKVKLTSGIGSKKKFDKMVRTLKDDGIDVYMNGVTNYAYHSGFFDGFIPYIDAAKFVSKERAKLYQYSTVFYSKMDWLDDYRYYLLKAPLVLQNADKIATFADDHSAGVSFEDYGKDLSSDFNNKKRVSRESMMNSQVEQLQAYKDGGQQVAINMGNDYAIAYADVVTGMDLKGTNYGIIDRTVPFYQMAIHGLVNYTGEPLNLTQNMDEELLASAEYGAGLDFSFMDASSFEIQSTFYTHLFGAEYDSWHDKAVDIYNRYNDELGCIFNKRMLSHEYITDELTCTTYEDGIKVYVNHGYENADAADGITVPARDYKVVK